MVEWYPIYVWYTDGRMVPHLCMIHWW